MSYRGKRQVNRSDDCPVPTKRRKGRPPAAAEEEEASPLDPGWTPRPNNDLKISTIYNRSATEAPAELFRKDLISAMKLPDNEPLSADEYWTISDQWKQEWERGVQVPVNPDSLPGPSVTVIKPNHRGFHDFRLPKNKYIRLTKDSSFRVDDHHLSNMPTKAEKACCYDLDDCDIAWLKLVNGERASMGLQPVREDQLERVIEELEIRCWDKVQTIVKQEEGLGIEFDENVICDVCRSPDSEEGNEMVFCDCCNICVHQACYGITAIPAGSWLCGTCALGLRPECVLCPNKGGAMKCTRSGHKWAHVSCALWIPEVSIGCVERMEPITKISSIPQSRWALICVLCRERVGACIQCSVKTCKTAYHVTCAFKHGLEMRAIIEDENADDGVKLRSYCQKHSVTSKKDRCGSGSEVEEDDKKKKKRKDMTSEEKNQARAAKLQEIEAEFQKHVSPADVTLTHYEVDPEAVAAIYGYWVLKRRAGHNRPLLAPRSQDLDALTRQQERADLDKMRMFVQLRQDLERVRNLCYMVSRREKLSRSFFRLREQTFHKQVSVLTDPSFTLSSTELTAVRESNHGPSIYDRIYSHANAPELSTDFDTVLARIAGIASPTPEDKVKLELNGLVRGGKSDNPYRKMYFNGGVVKRRSSVYGSGLSSGSETDNKHHIKMDIDSATSSGDNRKGRIAASTSKKNSVINKEKKLSKKRVPQPAGDSSTEEETSAKNKVTKKWESPRSKSLRQMEKELTDKSEPTDDSDEIMSVKATKKDSQKISGIYSDSDTEASQDDDTVPSDSQQLTLRTKAAMKEFSAAAAAAAANKAKRTRKLSSRSVKGIKKEDIKEESSADEYIKEKDEPKSPKKKTSKDTTTPSELIVPQRKAAKKATESMRGTQVKPKSESVTIDQDSPLKDQQEEQKSKATKPKSKESKDLKQSKEGKLPNDIYEFDKDVGENLDILAFVPQRLAAKKAAEHLKSGRIPIAQKQPSTPDPEVENKQKSNELSKSKKEVDSTKSKKDVEVDKTLKQPVRSPEKKGRRTPKSSVSTSSSSSSSSSGSCSSSSSSGSEDEDSSPKKTPQKKSLFDPPELTKRRESQDKKTKTPEKKVITKKSDLPFLDKGQQSAQSSSSSSSSTESENESPARRKLSPSPRKSTDAVLQRKASDNKEQQRNRDDSSAKLAASKKFRKTPDKKLKTSDGRPEFQLQQPPTEREESSRHKDKFDFEAFRERKTRSDTDRLRQPETKHGDTAHKKQHFNRSRSNTPQRDQKPTVERSSRSPQKKEHAKPDRRERKSSNITEHSQDWRKNEVAEENRKKEKDKSEHIAAESRKTDKKVTVQHDSKKLEVTSDCSRRSISRKSIDSVIDKQDKISSHSKNDKFGLVDNRILEDKTLSVSNIVPRNKHGLIEKVPSPIPDSALPDKLTAKDRSGLKSDAQKSIVKPQVMHNEDTLKENRDDSSEGSSSGSDSDEAPETRRTPMKPTDIIKGNNNNLRIDEYSNKPYINETVTQNKSPKSSQQEKQTIFEDKSHNEDDFNRNSKHAQPVIDQFNEQHKSEIHLRRNSRDVRDNESKPNIQYELPTRTSSFDKERNNELQAGDFQIVEGEGEPKKISSRTSSLSAPSYQQRSIFSPQQPIKDAAVADLFDFGNDMLAVDETVNEDGFGLPRNSDENLHARLSFSFGSEIFFKEDSKEDSARETLNLVEKLRLEYAKKTTQSDLSEPMSPSSELAASQELDDQKQDIVQEPVQEPEIPAPPPLENAEPMKPTEIECSVTVMKSSMEHQTDIEMAVDHKLIEAGEGHKHDIPPYHQTDPYSYQACGMAMDIDKVPGREKVDRSNSAQADERWVPPSNIPHHFEPIPSPYTEMHGRNKWADSEVLPSRRSSTTSPSSSETSSHREEVDTGKRDQEPMIGMGIDPGFQMPPPAPNLLPDLVQFPGLHAMPYGPCTLPDGQPFLPYSEATQFVGAVGMFPPTCPQIPFSTAGLYPPPFPGPYSMMPKVPEETLHIPPAPCTAAFTSSSHNMALTAAMVSPNQPLTPMTPTTHEAPMTPAPFPEQISQLPPPSLEESPPVQSTETFNHLPPISQSEQVEPHPQPPPPPPPKPPIGKKSPAKPTRSSARVIQQQKSPAKSPGISPRQLEAPKTPQRVRDSTPRGRGRGRGGGARGRPRGRGRGRGVQHYAPYHDPNTIHSKLVGTVYDFDFDDDIDNSLENLRAMRERRRSTDIHERKSSDSSFLSRDSSSSPKFASPHHNTKVRSSYAADVRDLRPPTPITTEVPNHIEEEESGKASRVESFDVVQPLLPGPVDMRTYNSSYEQTSSSLYHNSLIGAFTTNTTTEQPDYALDDLEQQLDQASAKKNVSEINKVPEDLATSEAQVDNSSIIKGLSDSRNQLKVKIKGPFLDANYTSSVVPTTQPVLPPVIPDPSVAVIPTSVSTTGSSNLRRMRKKELLRQYWTQENMDEPTAAIATGQVAPPTAAPPPNRAIITIPKAVASMTSIPTREDYMRYNEGIDSSFKRRKDKKDLDIMDDEEEVRNSIVSVVPDPTHPIKRRGRQPRNSSVVATPKLKIKFGNNTVESNVIPAPSTDEKKNLRERPPKKRLSSVPKPSLEELKRESMQFRKLMMANFDEEEKKKSKEVSSGRKKKKTNDVQVPEVQVITDTVQPKLIIRFGKRNEDKDNKSASAPPQQTTVVPSHSPPPDPPPSSRTSECSGLDEVRKAKITPIRLKLSRCEEGYVMKDPMPSSEEKAPTSSIPLSQDCEVR